MATEHLKVLIGWKEIASYLNCSRSTAVRRLKDGLPVFRVGGSVRAFAADIDRWLEGERLRKLEGRGQAEAELVGNVVNDKDVVETVAAYVREGKGKRYAVVPLGIDTSEYERIESRLKTAEEKSRWLLETIPVWVWETNVEGEYTYSNVASLDILGYRPEELAGFKPTDFLVHREDAPLYQTEVGKLRKKQAAARGFRCRFLNREDEVRWLEVDAEPAFDARGGFAGVRGVSRDVTARVRAEEKEREHLENLSFLSGSAMAFVGFKPEADLFAYVADKLRTLLGGVVVLASYDRPTDSFTIRAITGLAKKTRAAVKILGKDPLGLTFSTSPEMKKILYSGNLRKTGSAMDDITAGAISKRASRKLKNLLDIDHLYFMGIVRHDELLGAVGIVPSAGTELRNPEVVEAFIAQAGIALQRKYAEDAHRESEEKYRHLVDRSLVGLYITQNHILKYCNQRFVEMFGYDGDEELLGKSVRALIAPESWETVDERVKLRESGRQDSAHYVFKGLKKDGTPFDVETLGGRITYEGRPAFQGGMIDITDRQRAEEARERERAAFRAIAECAVEPADTPTLCNHVLERLVAALGFDFATVELYDAKRGLLYNGAAVGLTPIEIEEKEISVPLDDERHVSAYVGRTREALFVPDVKEHPINETHGPWLQGLGVRGFISWPLVGAEGQLLGVLQLASRTPKTVAEGDQIFFATVAGMFATVLERRRAEEALRRSEEFNRAVIERSPLGISVRDRNGRLLSFNDEWRKIWAITDEEIARDTATERPELKFDEYDNYLADWFDDVRRVYREGGYLHVPELEVTTAREGAAQWVNHYFYAIKGPTGEVDRVVILTEDITERKRAQDALEESEEKFRNLVERSNDGIAIVIDGRLAYANPRISEALGYAAEEMTDEPFARFIHPAELPRINENYQKRLRGEDVPAIYETAVQRADGSPMPVELNVGIVPYRGQTTVLVFIRDLTERKKAEEARERERRAFRTIAEAAVRAGSIQGLCRRVVSGLADALGFEIGAIRLYEEETETLERTASYGMTRDEIDDFFSAQQLDDRRFFAAHVARTREPIFAPDVSKHDIAKTHRPRIEELGLAGVISWPVVGAEGVLLGVITLASRTPKEIGEQDRVFFETVAGMFATVLERRRAEDEVRKSEAKHRLLLESIGSPVLALDRKMNILYYNDAYAVFADLPREEMEGKNLLALFPSFAETKSYRAYLEALSTDTPREAEGEFAGRYLRTTVYPMPWGILAVATDITERRRTEEALRDSEERYRVLFEGGNDAIFVFNLTADGKPSKFVEVNNEACRYLGYSAAELHRLTPADLVPPENRADAAEKIRRLLEEKEFIFEWVHLRKDGTEIPVEISSHLFGFRGELTAISIVRDIAERKRAEEALRESEEKYRATVEQARDGIVIVVDGKLAFVNEYYATMLGYAKEDLIGLSILDTLPERFREEFAAMYERAIKSGVSREPVDAVLLTADGREIPAETVSTNVNFDGRPAILVITRNVAEKRAAETELRRAAREKTAILSNMSEHVVYHNTELEILWANEAAASSVDLSPENLVGRHCYEIWHDRDQPCESCPVLAALETGGPHETDVTTPDGRAWFVRGYPIKDEGGNVTNAVEVTLEITELKRAEEALRESENRFRSVVEQSPFSTAIYGPDGTLLLANEAFGSIWGIPPEAADSFLGSFNLLTDKQIRAAGIGAYVERAFAGEVTLIPPHFYKWEGAAEAGWEEKEVWVRGFFYPVKNPAGEVHEVVAMLEDVTEQIQAEEALRDSERRYRALFDGGNDAVFVFALTEDGLPTPFTDVNDEACTRLGYSKEELLKLTPADITTPENRPRAAEKIEQLLQYGEAIFEWTHVTKSGKIIPVEISSHLFEFRRHPAIFSIVRDITARKRTEEALKKSEERYRTLAADLPVGVFRAKADGEIVSANAAAIRIFGFASEEDMTGRSAWDISLDSRRRRDIPARLAEEGAARADVSVKRNDGKRVRISLELRGEFDPAGELSFVNAIVQADPARADDAGTD